MGATVYSGPRPTSMADRADFVVSFSVLEHVKDKDAYMADAKRIHRFVDRAAPKGQSAGQRKLAIERKALVGKRGGPPFDLAALGAKQAGCEPY